MKWASSVGERRVRRWRFFQTYGVLWGMVLCFWMGFQSSAAAAETVTIPDYPCIIDYQDVYYQDSRYPLLSYKNVTYFPMTYEYCQALNLSSVWVEGEGLYIVYFPSYGELPIYPTTQNARYQTAEIADYPIYINGKRVNNATEEYPLLNFRNVTYFPMTWKYAREEFNWETNWDGQTFTLYSSPTNGSGTYATVYDVGETDAKVHKLFTKLVLLDADTESYTIENTEAYYSFDYATGELTEIPFSQDGYDNYYNWLEAQSAAQERDFSIVDGKIVCEGQALAEIQALKDGSATEADLYGYANAYTYDGIEIYHFTVYTAKEVPAPYTPRESYAYVKKDGQFIFIEENAFIRNAAQGNDGKIYVNVEFDSGWKGHYIPAEQLYCLEKDGTVTKINERYPDYNSMKILGAVNGTLYLKCEWFSDYSIGNFTYRISPYQDGYFTFDGTNLKKIAPYVYTDSDFLTPAGHIYGVIQWKDEIREIY